jgi:hypothetical protein
MTLPASGNSISLNQVNTELGRTATALIEMNDAAVRTLFGVGGSGTTISMSSGFGKSSLTISLATLTSVYGEANNSTATAGLDFNSNGYMSRSSSGYGTVSMGQWATSSSVGSNYWIRLTQTSQLGITTVTGAARGVWHQLSTTRTFGVSTSSLGYGSKTYTVEIASDSGGATIVATKTGVEIAAENVDQNA